MSASTKEMSDNELALLMRSCIQRIATGPELSKDITYEEARGSMRAILDQKVDPVQAAIFLIALRMKRETDDENRGVLQAIIDASDVAIADIDDVLDISDPYDGWNRGLPMVSFLPVVLAACGVPSVTHGLERVGPKYGVTARKVLRAAGKDVDLGSSDAANRLADADIGWAYVDQKQYCAKLHDLVDFRTKLVKRPCITTVEVLVGPVRGKLRTHLMTGYVHKAYPPLYANLARHAGFDSAMIVRGVEGGVIPSLEQSAKIFYYHDKRPEQDVLVKPADVAIEQSVRCVPLPEGVHAKNKKLDGIAAKVDTDALAERAAKAGILALKGEKGPAFDSLVYATAIALKHLDRYSSFADAANAAKAVLVSGAAYERFNR